MILRSVDSFSSQHFLYHNNINNNIISSTNRATSLLSSSRIRPDRIISASVPHRFDREEGLQILDTHLLPKQEYGNRIGYGRDAQGLQVSSSAVAVKANDPSMVFTYGEFPTESMDILIDAAMNYIDVGDGVGDTTTPAAPINLLDLGSGCGRLVLYSALTRGIENQQPWNIYGIEISEILHSVANQAVDAAISEGLLLADVPTDAPPSEDKKNNPQKTKNEEEGLLSTNSLSFYLGSAETLVGDPVLSEAQIIFAYSTVWASNGFSEKLCAMIMDEEWSQMLARACPKGCIVITTDRVLDPKFGWELVKRIEVDNREVLGSTGFIQILR